MKHEPIWGNHQFKPLHYRVLWWMIDMGAMRGLLQRGWMQIASADLHVHRISLNRAVKRLMEKGFVIAGKKGSFGLVPSAFDSDADTARVTVLPREGAVDAES